MLFGVRTTLAAMALGAVTLAYMGANPQQRDGIAEILKRTGDASAKAEQSSTTPAGKPAEAAGIAGTTTADATADTDPSQEQAQRLMKAVDAILQDAAKNRGEARKLPGDGDFLIKPLWTETREDRERK